jgi:hypothetical protein
LIQYVENFVFSAIAPALLSHKDVANAENAGAIICLPPASLAVVRVFVVNNAFSRVWAIFSQPQ